MGESGDSQTAPTNGDFKSCPCCGESWSTREAFLADRQIQLCGYQVHFRELELGLFVFDHRACGTSLSLHVRAFRDLHPGPVFTERLTGADDCPGYCLHRCELRPCPNYCECAYIRDIIQQIKN